ncbi:MAG: hypothetical protein LUF25_03060 [Phascolarctobacterium sp.]|nr:hypothetical protein [Phascolarctobacterium sp.]
MTEKLYEVDSMLRACEACGISCMEENGKYLTSLTGPCSFLKAAGS